MRQIVLWERKIALERETQAAVDTTEDEAEIAAMEKELSRLQQRHEGLKREQERLVGEMEKTIERREIIAMKRESKESLTLAAAATLGKGVMSSTVKQAATLMKSIGPAGAGATSRSRGGPVATDAMTRVGLKQKAVVLRRELEQKVNQLSELETALASKTAEAQQIMEALSAKAEQTGRLQNQLSDAQRAVHQAVYEKQKGVEALASLNRMLDRFAALEAGRLPLLTATEASRIWDRVAEAEASLESVRALVGHLMSEHEDLHEVLDRVNQLIDLAPEIPKRAV